MAIPISEIKPLLTTTLFKLYNEFMVLKATMFLQSFFKTVETKVRYPSYEVRRGTENIAIDVVLGHQGNRQQITKATQKIIDPFYFKEYFEATDMDCYWNLFGSTVFNLTDGALADVINGINEGNKVNIDHITRAYELFCSQILEFGTVTSFRDGSVVNFNRKAASIVDLGAGNYWAITGTDPYKNIQDMCDTIRKNGKYSGGQFHLVLGETAFADLMTNSTVLQRNDIKMWQLDDINRPVMNSEGQTYHGTISCGPYICHLWQYPQYFNYPVTGVMTNYVNPKKVFVIPAKVEWQLVYAATPQLVDLGTPTPNLKSGKFVMRDYMNAETTSHKFFVESRGMPVPVDVDNLGTIQVVA